MVSQHNSLPLSTTSSPLPSYTFSRTFFSLPLGVWNPTTPSPFKSCELEVNLNDKCSICKNKLFVPPSTATNSDLSNVYIIYPSSESSKPLSIHKVCSGKKEPATPNEQVGIRNSLEPKKINSEILWESSSNESNDNWISSIYTSGFNMDALIRRAIVEFNDLFMPHIARRIITEKGYSVGDFQTCKSMLESEFLNLMPSLINQEKAPGKMRDFYEEHQKLFNQSLNNAIPHVAAHIKENKIDFSDPKTLLTDRFLTDEIRKEVHDISVIFPKLHEWGVKAITTDFLEEIDRNISKEFKLKYPEEVSKLTVFCARIKIAFLNYNTFRDLLINYTQLKTETLILCAGTKFFIEGMETRLNERDELLSNKENSLSATEARVSDKEKNLSATEARLSDLEKSLSATAASLSDKEKSLSATAARLSDKEKDLCATAARLSNQEKSLSKIKERNIDLQKNLDALWKNSNELICYSGLTGVLLGLVISYFNGRESKK